jgi:hypothetical protein
VSDTTLLDQFPPTIQPEGKHCGKFPSLKASKVSFGHTERIVFQILCPACGFRTGEYPTLIEAVIEWDRRAWVV